MLNLITEKLHYKKSRATAFSSSFFRKSLIIVLLITCLPTSLLGVSLYFIGVNRVEAEVNRTHQLRLKLISEQIDQELSLLEVRLAKWVFNPTFGERVKTTNFADDFQFTRDLLRTLLVMQETNPFIAEIYMYVEDKALISSSKGVNVITASEAGRYESLQRLMHADQTMFWTKSLELPGISESALTQTDFKYSLVHKLTGNTASPYGVLIVRLNPAKLSAYFDKDEEAQFAILLDQQGDWLIRGHQQQGDDLRFESQLHASVMKHWPQRKQDTFLSAFRDTEYTVSYYTFARLGTEWIFTTASDLSNLSKPVMFMSRLIIVVSMIGFFTAILLSWLASHKLYQPIGSLIRAIGKDKTDRAMEHGDELKFIEKEWQHLSRESHMLQTRVEEQLPTLREGFMLQLAQGRLYYLAEEELRARIAYYGWDTDDRQFTVMVVQLNGLDASGGKFKEDDEQLVTFAAANIIEELTRVRLEQAYVINFQDLSVGIVIGFPSGSDIASVKQELSQFAQDVISTLNAVLHLQLTVCIGQLSTELGSMPTMFEDVHHTLRFRRLMESNQIIHIDDELLTGDFTFRYPFEIEKELIYALRLGQEEEANAKAEAFIRELERNAGVQLFVHQAMSQLVGNINNALLQAGFHVYAFHAGQRLYEELLGLRHTEEMLKWLQKTIISPYVKEMNQNHQAHLTQTVEKVVRMVEESFMTDLSLEACADQLGVNVSSLSKFFKQVKGINYVDYLTNVRIETSKKLLLETDLKISEIAEKVGYQHSWYNRVFKKSEGVTPSQYRDQHQ
ncbi:helix-turn-helix transcriptional regulator [Paenibacillus xanthanilyticus]|uniref:Helix-turn-helix transcriptional regulator n=1 Tax=Paenibacillus xanthanilyticus TaxID=1783531 RepID=A0ABV8K9G5_9BACL